MRWQIEAGADEAIGETPLDRFAAPAPGPAAGGACVAASGGGMTDGAGAEAEAAKRSRGVSPMASSAPASICQRKSATLSADSAMARSYHVRYL